MGTQIGFHCAVKGYSVCFHDACGKALGKAMPSCMDKFGFAFAAQPATADEKDNVLQRIRWPAASKGLLQTLI
jgi:3-hydroxyacyl-CoA dehydrogenase